MRRLLVAVLAAVALLATSGTASADGGWLSECSVWHGEQACREQYTHAHIPSTGEIGPKGRACQTSWADRRDDCGSQA